MQGRIKLHRQLADNPLWFAEPFTRGQAWVDLLMLANHKDSFFYVRGNKIDIQRGQIGMSEEALSERWKWSRGKVRRDLNELEKMQQIVQQKSKVKSLIILVNFDKYQSNSTTDGTTDSTTDGHQIVQQTDTNKNVKKENNDNNTSPQGDQMRLQQFYEINDREAFKELCVSIASEKKVIEPEAEFEAFEKYYLAPNRDKSKAYRTDWKRTFQSWANKAKKKHNKPNPQDTYEKNKELAANIHARAVKAFQADGLIDVDSPSIQDKSVFLAIFNKGYSQDQVVEQVNALLRNPPYNGLTSWGILYKQFP